MYVVVVGNNRKTVRALVRSSNGAHETKFFRWPGLSKKGGKAVTGRPPNNRSSTIINQAKQKLQTSACNVPAPRLATGDQVIVVSNRRWPSVQRWPS
jgi:hypothetical protein